MESVKLEFLGQVYHLKSDDPEVDIQEIAKYVEAKARAQEKIYGSLPPHKLVVLTVMNIGKDYIKVRDRLRALESTVSHKTNELVARIESAIDFTDR